MALKKITSENYLGLSRVADSNTSAINLAGIVNPIIDAIEGGGSGGSEQTEVIHRYVSPYGVDTNDGLTLSTAFRTLARALQDIPSVLSLRASIHLEPDTTRLGGEVYYLPEVISKSFKGDGCLQIGPTSQWWSPLPFTFSVVNISPLLPEMGSNGAEFLEIELYGALALPDIRNLAVGFNTGVSSLAENAILCPIVKRTDTTIVIKNYTGPGKNALVLPSIGDAFTVYNQTGITLARPYGSVQSCTLIGNSPAVGQARKPGFVFCGVGFRFMPSPPDLSVSGVLNQGLYLKDADTVFTQCTIAAPRVSEGGSSNESIALTLDNSRINKGLDYTEVLFGDTSFGIDGACFLTVLPSPTEGSPGADDIGSDYNTAQVRMRDSSIDGLVSSCRVSVYGTENFITRSLVAHAHVKGSSHLNMEFSGFYDTRESHLCILLEGGRFDGNGICFYGIGTSGRLFGVMQGSLAFVSSTDYVSWGVFPQKTIMLSTSSSLHLGQGVSLPMGDECTIEFVDGNRSTYTDFPAEQQAFTNNAGSYVAVSGAEM